MAKTDQTKPNVLLVLEGSYPYGGGGISTWAHQLTHGVSNAEFTIYSINAGVEQESKYELSENVRKVIQVPLWSPDEPHEYFNYGKHYYRIVLKKKLTTEQTIKERFIPLFRQFLDIILTESDDVKNTDIVFFGIYKFFQDYDFKTTMSSKPVWEVFKERSNAFINDEYPATIEDLVVGLRWFYRFLIPLSLDIPKADIAHITLSGFPIIPALILKYRYGTPIIITEHGVFIRERLLAINSSNFSYFLKNLLIKFSECITKLAYHKANYILSVNAFNINWENMYGAAKDKIKVIYNGVDHTLFTPRPKPDHLKNIPTVVAAARIFELKDIITMIKACDVVRKTVPNVKFLVYGNKTDVPEYTEKCERLIDKLRLRENFELAGFHPSPHLIYSEGDISVLSSISEGFPFTVIESMSAGVPVVATDVGGVSEALDDMSGLICKPRDTEDIGNKVVKLLLDRPLRERMSKHARQRVLENFTIQEFISKYQEVYKELYEEFQRTKIMI